MKWALPLTNEMFSPYTALFIDSVSSLSNSGVQFFYFDRER